MKFERKPNSVVPTFTFEGWTIAVVDRETLHLKFRDVLTSRVLYGGDITLRTLKGAEASGKIPWQSEREFATRSFDDSYITRADDCTRGPSLRASELLKLRAEEIGAEFVAQHREALQEAEIVLAERAVAEARERRDLAERTLAERIAKLEALRNP